MGVTYHFGYPNMQRIVAIHEAVNNAQNGENYQVNYRGKYRPLTVIEVPIEMLVYRIENIRTKSLQRHGKIQQTKSWDNFCSHLFIKNPALPVVARRLFAAIKSDIICCSIKNITVASLVTF